MCIVNSNLHFLFSRARLRRLGMFSQHQNSVFNFSNFPLEIQGMILKCPVYIDCDTSALGPLLPQPSDRRHPRRPYIPSQCIHLPILRLCHLPVVGSTLQPTCLVCRRGCHCPSHDPPIHLTTVHRCLYNLDLTLEIQVIILYTPSWTPTSFALPDQSTLLSKDFRKLEQYVSSDQITPGTLPNAEIATSALQTDLGGA
jgi:hypothetical protein